MLKKITNFIFDIRVAWTLMILYLISLFLYLGFKDAFKDADPDDDVNNDFFHFGPDTSGNTKFFNMKLNDWSRVGLVYFFCFLITFMTKYYEGIMDYVIYSTVWNPAYKDPMTISKPLTFLFLLSDPIIWWLQGIIYFYVLSIRKFQFLLPALLGEIVARWPYNILRINNKTYN